MLEKSQDVHMILVYILFTIYLFGYINQIVLILISNNLNNIIYISSGLDEFFEN